MTDLFSAILNLLATQPGLDAAAIARQLSSPTHEIKNLLYGALKPKVRQDNQYRWYIRDTSTTPKMAPPVAVPKSELGRLSSYYLACLAKENIGAVSAFVPSHEYVELASLPMLAEDAGTALATPAVQSLVGGAPMNGPHRKYFIGYPLHFRRFVSQNGNLVKRIEPLLLFTAEGGAGNRILQISADEPPQINYEALRYLANTSDSGLLDEGLLLAEELGLSNAAGTGPELDDLMSRLRSIRSDWPWAEPIDPRHVSSGIELSGLDKSGIYNRCVLIGTKESSFTKGLENELGTLRNMASNAYAGTALGWLIHPEQRPNPIPDNRPLLEVVALNGEQRQAVKRALTMPLTVITGPPGTGKSQVVTSILVNASWRGKTVLFASRNNKAVDVVEARANALGSRPVLLRLGPNQFQADLANYLSGLLAATTTQSDRQQHDEETSALERISQRFAALEQEASDLITLRNEVDQAEQAVELLRASLGDEVFQAIRLVDMASLRPLAHQLIQVIARADVRTRPLHERICWPFLRGVRRAAVHAAMDEFLPLGHRIGCPALPANANDWTAFAGLLSIRLNHVERVRSYWVKLEELLNQRPLELIAGKTVDITSELAVTSARLWQSWLKLQPARLTAQQRPLLGNFSALLQMMVAGPAGRQVCAQYYQLFPAVAGFLTSWAVTNLSAHRRLPLSPQFFDLLVIDEASQCDIASVLPLLYRAKRVVVIGDPKQLRHITTLTNGLDQQLLVQAGLLATRAGWAYSSRSLFDLASSECAPDDIINLRDHHRSHADIIEFSNREFYDNSLRVATRQEHLRSPSGGQPPVRWIDVRGVTSKPDGGSAFNDIEAKAVISELKELVSAGYRGSVAAVSPFTAQAQLIRDLAHGDPSLSAFLTQSFFESWTVHQSQGDERDIIIFSPVIAAGAQPGMIGFLRNTPYLFNVAITRARAALTVIGDRSAATSCDVKYLERFSAYVDQLPSGSGIVGQQSQADHGPEYPSVRNSDSVSEWEKILYRKLRTAGIVTVPQYRVEQYLLDLALFENGRRLAIEVDGERYHRSWDGELCRRDQIRNQRLMELGWDVMRFWVYQIRDDLDACVSRVQAWKINAGQ